MRGFLSFHKRRPGTVCQFAIYDQLRKYIFHRAFELAFGTGK